jgi:hypothetical protein
MERWISRWAPLAGVLAAVLLVVAFVSGGSSPDVGASASRVTSYYTAHATQAEVSSLAGVLAFIFLVFFALALAGRMHARGTSGWLANGAVAGAVLAAVGFLPILAFTFMLGDDITVLGPSTAQTLNVLSNDYWLPAAAGFAVFGILTGLAVAASRVPSRWMGWVLFAFGIVCAVPPVAWFAMLGTFLWTLIAGVWLTVRAPAPVEGGVSDARLTTVG